MESYASIVKRCCVASATPWTIRPPPKKDLLQILKEEGIWGNLKILKEEGALNGLTKDKENKLIAYLEEEKRKSFAWIGEKDREPQENLFHFEKIKNIEEFILELQKMIYQKEQKEQKEEKESSP